MADRLSMIRAFGLMALFPALLHAQQDDVRTVGVAGMVYDSLSRAPVAEAVVTASGSRARSVTDARGRFYLELPPGAHLLEFSHTALPTWSLARNATVVEVDRSPVEGVRLATASEGTIIQRACASSGSVVGGVVLDMLTRVPVVGASVDITGVVAGKTQTLGRAATSPSGDFQLCVGNLPDGEVRLQAAIGGHRSRVVTLSTEGRRVVTADLNVLVSQPARISGVLTDGESRRPVADALVRVDGTRLAARSADDGAFLIRGVPPGAVTLSVEHVRYGRRTTEVLAESGDSVHVEFELMEEAIPLAEMVVRVIRPRTSERNRSGTRFDGLDRPQIERLLSRSHDMEDLLRNANIPGLSVVSDGQEACVQLGRRTGALGNTCHMADVYLNDVRVSNPRVFLATLQPELVQRVRVISPLEAVGRYSGTALKFGVLLIYTRPD